MCASISSRRRFLKKFVALAAASATAPLWLSAAPKNSRRAPLPPQVAPGAKRPNIIFVLADDLGLDGVSYTGGDLYRTPHIDELARGGMQFHRCYAPPQCGPARAELLTGRYPFRTGMTDNALGVRLNPSREYTVADVLKSAGYVTASVGKWAQMPLEPSDWGFDEYFRFKGSGGYWNYDKRGESYTVNGKTHKTPDGVYLPDLMHQFAVDFITRHQKQPFFLYYPMSHVHAPILPTPDSVPGSTDLYADNIAYMDKLVGQLVSALDRLGLRENTVILFAGDNGTAPRYAERGTVAGKAISGEKHTLLEGGSRVPLFVNWKGTIPGGKVCGDLTDFSDFLPTFSQLAGASLPPNVVIDGHSFASQLQGGQGTPRDWVFVELEDAFYVATKRWKLNNDGDLIDLRDAPFKEVRVPRASTDPQAVAARAHLEQILVALVGKQRAFTSSKSSGLYGGSRRGGEGDA